MVSRRKFGAFAGVFTPSILTILGVIMYLRLPQIVGQAGLWGALGILVAAHVISITTGLSVSSIATDKRVKAGGSYYIISRSLGLPIGGTLGLALFVGLSFSVSLYVIGFSESFLSYWHIGIDPLTDRPDIDSIRVCGSIALAVVTIITFISTSLAIKTQYLIMAAIILSLTSIVIGNPDMPSATVTHFEPLAEGVGMGALFAIFFPAVTGFEAGVSMSGDLKNPRRDIPRGTLIAIAVGFVVYAGEVLFFSVTIPADQLAHNPRVLLEYAWIPALVVAGIWGATISSALGSILGAPRILQAAAMDKIAPKLFAKGAGPDNEPRNAVLLTFLIAEGGILIGSLDAIAAVVTMFFMASYGVLNLSCAVERWASPDFRPEFKIPRIVSVVGALVCFGLMILLDPVAMLGAVAVLGLLYVWLKRKELALEGGDTWTGIWSSLARKALDRLSRSAHHHRNWRPNLLLFSNDRTPRAVASLCQDLVAHNGVSTEIALLSQDGGPSEEHLSEATPRREGAFRRELKVRDPLPTIAAVARFHGIANFEPNTVVIDWSVVRADPAAAAGLLSELADCGRNVALSIHRGGGAPIEGTRFIDVWWRGTSKNLAFGLALVRFLNITGEWRQATPRFMVAVADPGQKRTLERRLGAWLADARLSAEVHVMDAPGELDTFEALVTRVSASAALALVSLPDGADGEGLRATVDGLQGLARPLLLMRAEPGFSDPFPHVDLTARAATVIDEPRGVRRDRASTLRLGEDAALGRQVLDYHDALASALDTWHQDGPVALLQALSSAHADVARLVERALTQLANAAAIEQAARRKRTILRTERGLLRGIEARLAELAPSFGAEQRETLRAALGAFADRLHAAELELSETLLVPMAATKRFVRWPLRRFVAAQHAAIVPEMLRDAAERLRVERERLIAALEGFVAWALSEVVHAREQLAAASPPGAWSKPDDALRARLAVWDELVASGVSEQRREAAAFARDAAQRLSLALQQPKKTRRVRGGRGDHALDADGMSEELAAPLALQRHHVERAQLDVTLRALHLDLAEMRDQTRADLEQHVRRRTLASIDQFLDDLAGLADKLASEPQAAHELRARDDILFDQRAVLRHVSDVIERDTEALPEALETLSEVSFQALSDGRLDDLEEVTIEVRRMVAFVLKSDLLGALRESLGTLAATIARAGNTARDVARLVSFAATGAGESAAGSDEIAELGEERLEIVAAARERVSLERAHVERDWAAAERLLDERLAAVIERTRINVIGQSSGKLDRFVRTHERAGLGSRFGALLGRARDGVRKAAVDLSYRWIRGLLLARRLTATASEPASPVERIIALHGEATPPRSVVDALPIFYRQIFLGRAAADPAYWVPAATDLAAAERGIGLHALGRPGALWVTGPQGSGVGAVLRRLTQKHFAPDKTFLVRAPEQGSIDPARFARALSAAVGLAGEPDEVLATLPRGSVLIIEELELWWERTPGGLAVIRQLSALCERHGGRVLFVVGVNVHVMRLLRRLGVMVDQVLATVHCRPLDARGLREAVLRRHEATGLGLRLEGDTRDRPLGDWRAARLFTGLFEHSDGYIGAALHGWIAHISEVKADHIVVRRPRGLEVEALDALDPDWLGILLELVLHRRMDRARLARVTGLTAARLDTVIAGLARTGLVQGGRDNEPIALDRFMRRHLERWLESRGVL